MLGDRTARRTGQKVPGPHYAADVVGDLVVGEHLRVLRGGRPALDDVSFTLTGGSVTGLFGPSGSGKTTLMRALVGVQHIDSGSLTVLGRPAGSPELRRRVAYTTQAPAMYVDLTIRENLGYFARILGVDAARVAATIEEVGLRGLDRRVVATLSGGEQARVSLAIALLGDAELLVLDEPTVGLDPLLRIDLWKLFDGLAAAGRTLLVSSHVLDEATHCAALVLLRNGGVVAHGEPSALCAAAGVGTVEEAFVAYVRDAVPAP
jgi:ABC-2 type transport system ATP-binding protein